MIYPLRPYQHLAYRAIIDSVVNGRGLTFTIEYARQGGKNEVSARIQSTLLALHIGIPLIPS